MPQTKGKMMFVQKIPFIAVIAFAALLAACSRSGSDSEKEEASSEPKETTAATTIDSVDFVAQDAARAAEIAAAAQRDQTEQLRVAVEKEMLGQNIRVKSFTLVHKSGNEYKGVLVAKQPVDELVFGEFTYMVDVVFDGKTIVWEASSGKQTACCEPMSAEEIQDLMKEIFEAASGIRQIQAGDPPGADSPGAFFSPLQPNGQITLGRCHMSYCSWSKWISVKSLGSSNAELTLEFELLGGESEHADDYPSSPQGVAINWNSEPHTVKVVCSPAAPSVSDELLPLNPETGVPGVQESAAELYFAACHSHFDGYPSGIEKFSYKVKEQAY